MRRRVLAVLAVAALSLCVGRVGAWASSAADAHACCHVPKGSAPALSACCPVAAATVAPRLAGRAIAALAVAPLRVSAPKTLLSSVEAPAAPPGVETCRAASPARAPPLA